MTKTLGGLLVALILLGGQAFAQSQNKMVIDQVVGVVGKNPILKSDIEKEYLQMRVQGNLRGGAKVHCEILEDLLIQRLMLHQASLDSVVVTDERVESAMDQRLRYYISQFGSEKKLEEFYDKSLLEIKDEMREMVREQMMVEEVQRGITSDIQVTPSEVKSFFTRIPKDSIPLINTDYEIGQIVKQPPVSQKEMDITRNRLKDLRQRILQGESFNTLAILYSEDQGSAKKGGELGFYGRGELYPEFEAAAFNLKKDELSEIIKTQAGYHIIQMIDRRGEQVNVKHILLIPKVNPEDLDVARQELDSIRNLIIAKKYTFEEAARQFSDDPNKINGGLLINRMTQNTHFEADQLDPQVFFTIDKMQVGDVSLPVKMVNEEGKEAFRLLMLRKRTHPHRANLTDDYDKIQQWATNEKQYKMINDWVDRKIKSSFVKVSPEYQSCSFNHNWMK